MKYYWNYEQVYPKHIWVKVQYCDEHRWYNFECDVEGDVNGYSFFPALEFVYLDTTIYISNDCGTGIHSLRKNNMNLAKQFKDGDIKRIYRKGEDHYNGRVIYFNEDCYVETEAARTKYFENSCE